MIIVAILNAGRNAFSFFLVLIVCMGYGVVKPSLGKTMVYVRYLAAAHFVFSLASAITSFTVSPEHAGKLIKSIIYMAGLTLLRSTYATRHPPSSRDPNCLLHLDT